MRIPLAIGRGLGQGQGKGLEGVGQGQGQGQGLEGVGECVDGKQSGIKNLTVPTMERVIPDATNTLSSQTGCGFVKR